MRICEAILESLTPYSQSRFSDIPRLTNKEGAEIETADDHERRTWRERLHYGSDGIIFIPPMAFKNALSEIAKFRSEQIPGKGKATYTKHFEAGVTVMDCVPLGIHKDQAEGEWLFVPADGRRGSGKRVKKCFPVVREWKATVRFYIIDDVITEPVFERHLAGAGMFIGIGRFRPRNNGFYGRFKVVKVKWLEE